MVKQILFMLFSLGALAANKTLMTVEGSVTDSSNNPVSGTATVVAQILAPSGCVLWNETLSSVTLTNGGFVVSVGQTNTAAGSATWTQIFQNGVSVTGLTGSGCSGTYQGSATDDRTLYLTFSGSAFSSAQTSPAIPLKANPQNPLIAGYPVQLPSGAPTNLQVLAFDASNNWWYPVTTGSGTGTVTSVSSSTSAISVVNPTTTPVLTLNTVSIANGGTNSTSALTNDKLMVSTSGAIKEAGSMTGLSVASGVVSVLYGNSAGQAIQGTATAGGDLSGTFSALTVSKINGTSVSGVGVAVGDLPIIQSALTANQLLVQNSGNTGVSGVAPGTAGTFLRSNGTSWVASNISAGDVSIDVPHGGTGTTNGSITGVGSTNLTFTPATGYYINLAGNVGIGTSTPSTLLHIAGTAPVLRVLDGNQATGKVLTSDASGNSSWAYPTNLPTWTSIARPASPATGATGYNTTTLGLETYVSSSWLPVGVNMPMGYTNIAAGLSAGLSLGSGSTDNAILGALALSSESSASDNVIIGYQAATSTSGSAVTQNVVIGSQAVLTAGSTDNIAIGYNSKINNALNGAVVVGANSSVTAADSIIVGTGVADSYSYTIVIGNGVSPTQYQTAYIGDSNIAHTVLNGATADSTSAVKVGSTSSNGNGAYLSLAGTWQNVSDARIKENVHEIPYGLKEILQTHPVAYDMIGTHEPQVGFIAQEMYQVIPEVVGKPRDESKSHWSMSYGNLVAVAVKGIQEQQQLIDSQAAKIHELQGALCRHFPEDELCSR